MCSGLVSSTSSLRVLTHHHRRCEGADALRISLAHTEPGSAWRDEAVAAFKAACNAHSRLPCLLVELAGATPRTAAFDDPATGETVDSIALAQGETVTLHPARPGDRAAGRSTAHGDSPPARIGVHNAAGLAHCAPPGSIISIGDGHVRLEVLDQRSPGRDEVTCRAMEACTIKSRKRVHLPCAPAPTLTDADLADLKWAVSRGASFVAAASTAGAEDVHCLRDALSSVGGDDVRCAPAERPRPLRRARFGSGSAASPHRESGSWPSQSHREDRERARAATCGIDHRRGRLRDDRTPAARLGTWRREGTTRAELGEYQGGGVRKGVHRRRRCPRVDGVVAAANARRDDRRFCARSCPLAAEAAAACTRRRCTMSAVACNPPTMQEA